MVKTCSENLEAREDFMFCSRENFLSLFENELRCVERKDLLNNQVLILAYIEQFLEKAFEKYRERFPLTRSMVQFIIPYIAFPLFPPSVWV